MKTKEKSNIPLTIRFYLLVIGIFTYYLLDILIRYGLFESAARVKYGKGRFIQKVKKEQRRRKRK